MTISSLIRFRNGFEAFSNLKNYIQVGFSLKNEFFDMEALKTLKSARKLVKLVLI